MKWKQKLQRNVDFELLSDEINDFCPQSSAVSELSFLKFGIGNCDQRKFDLPSTSLFDNGRLGSKNCEQEKQRSNSKDYGTLVEGNFVILLQLKNAFSGITSSVDKSGTAVDGINVSKKGQNQTDL